MAHEKTANPPAWKPGDDDSPMHAGPWAAEPAFMYVHYLRGEKGPYPTYIFQLEKPGRELRDAEIGQAVAAIRAGEARPVPRDSGQPVRWRVLAHMVFVLADTTIAFIGSGIHFLHHGTRKNHTFFDGKITTDAESGFSVLRCINYRKNEGGGDLGPGGSEVYDWEAEHTGPFRPRFHDDSGNNTGP